MFEINMARYRETVRENKSYFQKLDEDLQKYTKNLSMMSRDFNKKKVLEVSEVYGGQSVEGILNKICETIPKKIHKDVVLWYVSFDYRFWEKVKKDNVPDLIRALKVIKPENSWEMVTTGFYMQYKGPGEGYEIEEDHDFSFNRRKLKPLEVILDTENRLYRYESALLYMYDNLDIFPKSIQKRMETLSGRSDKKGVREIKNIFQQQVYAAMLPKEYDAEFLKKELKRLTVKDHLNGYSFLVTAVLFFDGFLIKYGEGLMYEKSFSEQIFANIIRKHNANEEVKSLISKRLYKAMRFSVLNNMGLDFTEAEEKALCDTNIKEENENTVGA